MRLLELTIDSVELEAASAARSLLEKAFPLDRLREPGLHRPVEAWNQVSEAGWTHAGSFLADSDRLGLGCLAFIARGAGSVLLIDELTSNLVLIPDLIAAIPEPERPEWTGRHTSVPGYLIADGMDAGLAPFRNESEPAPASWTTYGINREYDAYWLERTGGRWILWRAPSSALPAGTIDPLALGTGIVTGTHSGAESAVLDLDPARATAALSRAAVAHSAGLCGLAETVTEKTVGYLQSRKQFGRLIGSFQALKHIVADVYADLLAAWLAVQQAAADPETENVLAARLLSAEVGLKAAKCAIQLHGGIGFTWDENLHYYLKTAVAGSARFGTPQSIAANLGSLLKQSVNDGKGE